MSIQIKNYWTFVPINTLMLRPHPDNTFELKIMSSDVVFCTSMVKRTIGRKDNC